MGITEKQKFFLKKHGVTDRDLENMSFEDASSRISAFKGNGQPTFQKASQFKEPEVQDKKSYYVSYAKDLCIAMLNAHVEARKIDQKVQPLEIGALMTAAVAAIQEAKAAF